MKKLSLLLALFIQTNAEPSYSSLHREPSLANIKTPFEINYKHPKARRIGEHMPLDIGEEVSYIDMLSINTITREAKASGLIIGYDRDGDKIPEYEFIRRFCDAGSDVETYAVFDVPHKLLYIDSSRNRYIDSIENIDSLDDAKLPMIPVKCM